MERRITNKVSFKIHFQKETAYMLGIIQDIFSKRNCVYARYHSRYIFKKKLRICYKSAIGLRLTEVTSVKKNFCELKKHRNQLHQRI